jgi:DNA-binding MarR family transcriptional regulator
VSGKARKASAEQMSTAMRAFMAHAVLYQDAVAKWAGITSSDLQCAGLLMLHGPMPPSELASRSGLTAGGAITAVIDRLEKAGLAHRSRDDVDRRRVVVTPDAAALLELVGPVYDRIGARWSEYLATLDDRQIAFATELFSKAADINRGEVDWLRATPRPVPPTRRRKGR